MGWQSCKICKRNMIKFLDIQKITESFEPELSQAISRVIKRGWFLLGEEVKNLKKNMLQNTLVSKHCIGVANGLDALGLFSKPILKWE